MKSSLLTICLLIGFSFYAQNSGIKPGDQAMFTACLNEEDPYFCTDETFKNIITGLITPQITEEIKNSPQKDGLDVSILFISDEEGKIIKENIEVYCENRNLQATIRYLISRLPTFYPKSEKHTIRKSVHLYNLTFIPSTGYQSYILAPPSITNKHIGYDSLATYENCNDNIKDTHCFQRAVYKSINKHVDLPESLVSYNDSMNVYFLVNTDGNLIFVDLISGTEDLKNINEKLKNAIKSAFKKIPPAKPALIKGIPVIQDVTFILKTSMKVKNYYGN
jgi:hypothetical protein